MMRGAALAKLLRRSKTTKETIWEAEVYRIAGEIALMSPEPDAAKAEAYFERALAVAHAQQVLALFLKSNALMIEGLIYETNTSKPIACIKNGDELYSVASRRKFATIKDGELYCLTGASLGLTLADLNNDPDALAKFKALAERGGP